MKFLPATTTVAQLNARLHQHVHEVATLRPHEVGECQRDAVALHVEGEPERRHLMHVLMQTLVELSNRGRRW